MMDDFRERKKEIVILDLFFSFVRREGEFVRKEFLDMGVE